MENLKVKDLKALAKERRVKGYYKMRKAELIQALTPVSDLTQPEAPDIVYDLIDPYSPPPASATEKPIKKTELKNEMKRCPHGKQKHYCKECGGSQICPHERIKRYCKECEGKLICSHNRVKYTCKECGGKGICQHRINKRKCKECGGKGICQHGRQKYFCKECGGKGICKHGKHKYLCKDCGGKGICPHSKQKIKM